MLLTLFLYNLVGFYPAYTWRQHQFRKQAEHQRRAQLPDGALIKIKVAVTEPPGSSSPLQWQENDEFRWRGQLYDVVRQHTSADSITYLCWHDRGEEKLLAGLQKHIDELTHPSQHAGKTAKKLLSHLSKLAFFTSAPAAGLLAVLPTVRPLFPALRVAELHRSAAVPVPPPDPTALIG